MVEAMLRVAAEKGYEATRPADVAAAAGVTEAAFFDAFGDKEGCFLESYDAMIDLLVSRVSNAFVGAVDCPWPERVGSGLRALVELLASEPEIARMAMVEVTAIGEDARERYRAALERFVPFLDEGRAYSGQGDALPADTARLAIGGATSMIFEEVRAGRGAELKRVLPDLLFTVLMPFLGSEAAEVEMRRVAGAADGEA
jgi:AcrR family transcriptional regulator